MTQQAARVGDPHTYGASNVIDMVKDVVSTGYDKAKDVASGAWNWLTT